MKKSLFILLLTLFIGELSGQINYLNHISAVNSAESQVSHNGKFLYHINLDGLTIYEINTKTGGLTKKQTFKSPGGDEFSNVYLSPDDKFLYIQTFKGKLKDIHSEFVTYACDVKTGELKILNSFDNQDGERFEFNSNFTLSPAGNFLFITNNSHQDLLIYRRNTSTGEFAYLNKVHSELLAMYGDIAISPDEQFLNVFSQNIHKACIVYELNAQSGSLTEIQEVENPNYRHYTSADFIISPDGKNVYTIGSDVYAANQTQPQIGQYSRDVQTGMLSFQKNYDNLQSNGIRDLSFLYLDGSGDYLFALNSYGDELHGAFVFKRDVDTGDISYKQAILDKAPTDKLKGAYTMSFGKTNKHIYLSAARDNALYILENLNAKASLVMSTTVQHTLPETAVSSEYPVADYEIDEVVQVSESAEQNAGSLPDNSSENELTAIHKRLQSETSDTKRLDLCYALLEGKSLKTIQIASIAMLFQSEYKRLEFVKFASYFVSDKEHYSILEDLFTYESIRKDFRQQAAKISE
ncbi:MAG: beta-propeller fold lactonase family protein [Flavobacteriales bacterium]